MPGPVAAVAVAGANRRRRRRWPQRHSRVSAPRRCSTAASRGGGGGPPQTREVFDGLIRACAACSICAPMHQRSWVRASNRITAAVVEARKALTRAAGGGDCAVDDGACGAAARFARRSRSMSIPEAARYEIESVF